MKAAKPDVPVASVVKVDEADDPVRVADAVVDLAKADRVEADLVARVAVSAVARVADVGSASRRLRSRQLWTPTKTASFPPRKLKTQSLHSAHSTRTRTENWIATNFDQRAQASVVDVPVVVDRELAVLVAPATEPAWSIACWPTTKTKTGKSRKRKLRNF